jgi:hypothetical protein
MRFFRDGYFRFFAERMLFNIDNCTAIYCIFNGVIDIIDNNNKFVLEIFLYSWITRTSASRENKFKPNFRVYQISIINV